MTARPLGSLPLLDSSAPVPVDRPFLLAEALRAGASPHRVRMLEPDGVQQLEHEGNDVEPRYLLVLVEEAEGAVVRVTVSETWS